MRHKQNVLNGNLSVWNYPDIKTVQFIKVLKFSSAQCLVYNRLHIVDCSIKICFSRLNFTRLFSTEVMDRLKV